MLFVTNNLQNDSLFLGLLVDFLLMIRISSRIDIIS